VNVPPPDLPDAAVAAAVGAPVTYAPVGFGSHHWLAADAFVTVDDLDVKPWLGATRDETYDGLAAALATASALAHLPFVVAPRGPLRRLTDRYALAVYPRLDLVDEPADAAPLLALLHAAPVPPADPGRRHRGRPACRQATELSPPPYRTSPRDRRGVHALYG
jgi:hypothetical protein